jgi:GR25 family glycosyltransferase involved in LPS biosynthesis
MINCNLGGISTNNLLSHYGLIFNFIKFNNKMYSSQDISFLKYNNKINYIEHILWINLNRSIDRKKHMIELLSEVDIPNTRITAIDGSSDNPLNYIFPIISVNMTDNELACTLSHIKAIQSLKYKKGNYFMICEDDINFNNSYIMNIDLKQIIIESPPFEILLLSKICIRNLDDVYTKWIDEFSKGPEYHIASTGAYIISRQGIDKLCSLVSSDFKLYNNAELNVADIFLYTYLETYVYKYNFINTLDEDSTIHDDHIPHHKNSSIIQRELIEKDFLFFSDSKK